MSWTHRPIAFVVALLACVALTLSLAAAASAVTRPPDTHYAYLETAVNNWPSFSQCSHNEVTGVEGRVFTFQHQQGESAGSQGAVPHWFFKDLQVKVANNAALGADTVSSISGLCSLRQTSSPNSAFSSGYIFGFAFTGPVSQIENVGFVEELLTHPANCGVRVTQQTLTTVVSGNKYPWMLPVGFGPNYCAGVISKAKADFWSEFLPTHGIFGFLVDLLIVIGLPVLVWKTIKWL